MCICFKKTRGKYSSQSTHLTRNSTPPASEHSRVCHCKCIVNKKDLVMPAKRATAVCAWSLIFAISTLSDAPRWGMPCNINAIYTSLKSTFSELQFRPWQYGFIFIRLAVIASETRQMSRNSKRNWSYNSSRSSKVIDLGVNGKPICDFLLVINCNFSRICYRFRDIYT